MCRRLVGVLVLLSLAGTASGEPPPQQPWYVGSSLAITEPFDDQLQLTLGGVVYVGRRVHRIVELEARLQTLFASEEFILGLVRVKLRSSAKMSPLRWSYVFLGIGGGAGYGDSMAKPQFVFDLGAGAEIPMWDQIHLVVELAYAYGADSPRFDALTQTVGFIYRWH